MKVRMFILLSFIVFISVNSQAQKDSSILDLGRIQLKRDFTQYISIKAADLEKLPFVNLSDVIAVWLYGNYTNTGTVTYIIDGIRSVDANAYSIYDIEEIILVQNAVIQLSGISGQQQLIIITTKKGRNENGLQINGKSFLTNDRFTDFDTDKTISSKSTIHQQYNVKANKITKGYQAGVSLDYLHDVLPQWPGSGYITSTPEHLNRYRLNGFIDMNLGSKNKLSLNVLYAPQTIPYTKADSLTGRKNTYKENESVFNGTLKLNTQIVKNLVNEVKMSYYFLKSAERLTVDSSLQSSISSYSARDYRAEHYLLQDNLTYSKHIGDWHFDPSLNYSWFKIVGRETGFNSETNGFYLSNSGYTMNIGGRHSFLTPSFNFYYKNVFNIQAGIVGDITKYFGGHTYKRYPFISFSFDPFKLKDNEGHTSWRVFGSYAKSGYYIDNTASLADFNFDPTIRPAPSFSTTIFGSFGGNYFPNNYNYFDSTYWVYQTGTCLSLLNNKIAFNYNLEVRKLNPEVLYEIYTGNGNNIYIFHPYDRTYTNRISARIKIIDMPLIKWNAMLGAARIVNQFLYNPYPGNYYIMGDQNKSSSSWTGGLTNRIIIKQFSAGLDILYWAGHQYDALNDKSRNVNSFSLSNLFAAYTIHTHNSSKLQVFFSARNLFESKKSLLYDHIKYYGLGAGLAL